MKVILPLLTVAVIALVAVTYLLRAPTDPVFLKRFKYTKDVYGSPTGEITEYEIAANRLAVLAAIPSEALRPAPGGTVDDIQLSDGRIAEFWPYKPEPEAQCTLLIYSNPWWVSLRWQITHLR